MSAPPHAAALLNRLEGVKSQGRGLIAKCPSHSDNNPSLKIDIGDSGQALLHCFAGCSTEAIVEGAGLTMCDLFPPTANAAPKLEATYNYKDADGKIIERVQRWEGRQFRQHAADGHGGFCKTLNGVRLPLYHLPEVLAAETVYCVEGERDADRLRELGLTATCNAGGAGKFRRDHTDALSGRSVVFIPDNDDAGRDHVHDAGKLVVEVGAREVRVLVLPGLPEKGDVSDWLDADGTVGELHTRADDAPSYADWIKSNSQTLSFNGAPIVPLKDLFRTAPEIRSVTPEEPDWMAARYVARCAITEFDGQPKVGKTQLVMDLVRSVVTGTPFLDSATQQSPVVFLTEQSLPTYRVLLERTGLLDCDQLHVLSWTDTVAYNWPRVAEAGIAKALEVRASLLVVDTLGQFARLRGDDENSAGAALEAIAPLQHAAAAGLAVIINRHERKGGGEPGESARGSSAFGGAVDVIVQVKRPERHQRPTIRLLKALSRFDATPSVLTVEWTPEG